MQIFNWITANQADVDLDIQLTGYFSSFICSDFMLKKENRSNAAHTTQIKPTGKVSEQLFDLTYGMPACCVTAVEHFWLKRPGEPEPAGPGSLCWLCCSDESCHAEIHTNSCCHMLNPPKLNLNSEEESTLSLQWDHTLISTFKCDIRIKNNIQLLRFYHLD